jgi:hypothetical protein
LRDCSGHVRRLQAIGNVAAHGDGRHAVAPAHDGLLRKHLHLAHLRQRNALPIGAGQREVGDPGRIKPDVAGRPRHHLHGADILAHRRDRHAGQQELQLLRHGAGGQAHGLQAVLLQGEVQGRRAHAPVGIHGTHHRTGVHHALHLGGDAAQLDPASGPVTR